MSDRPNFGWILLAQSLSAGGELFGQRAGRACHQHSNLRLLLSTVVYSAVQAFVVLLVFELAAPHLTDGQGALGMWAELQRHPGECRRGHARLAACTTLLNIADAQVYGSTL